ncbi:MAG: hypothetical protein ACI837_000461 [Crocinitomicaceae bacterium]|jgi:hypothetical protein
MNEENWISEIMNVPDRMKSADIPDSVLQRLKSIPTQFTKKLEVVPMRTIFLAAASIAVLIAINILLFSGGTTTSDSDNFADTYFSHTKHL